jgi:molybdopterin converting factor small subunit
MRVTVRLYASLESYLPEHRQGSCCDLDIDEGTRVSHLVSRLGIPAEAPKLVFVNGVHARQDELLKDGDEVGVFPPVAGGCRAGDR